MLCQKCGAEMVEGAMFCPKCGARQDSEAVMEYITPEPEPQLRPVPPIQSVYGASPIYTGYAPMPVKAAKPPITGGRLLLVMSGLLLGLYLMDANEVSQNFATYGINRIDGLFVLHIFCLAIAFLTGVAGIIASFKRSMLFVLCLILGGICAVAYVTFTVWYGNSYFMLFSRNYSAYATHLYGYLMPALAMIPYIIGAVKQRPR